MLRGRGGGRREDLLQEAYDVGNILQHINSPRGEHAGRGNRGGERGGGWRGGDGRDGFARDGDGRDRGDRGGGRNCNGRDGIGRGGSGSGRGRDRNRWRQRGGGCGRGMDRDFTPRDHSVQPQDRYEQRPREESYLKDEGDPYHRTQKTGSDHWQDEREVGNTLGGQGGARRYHRNNNGNREQVGLNKDRPVEPHQLVKALTGQPTFSASLLQLMEQQQLTPAAVRATVSRYDLVFYLQDEEVQLRPQLDICAAHCGPGGCQDLTSCNNLHICPNMAVSRCDAGKDCGMGHHWHTNHNFRVLKSLYLDHLQHKVLAQLLKFLYGNQGQSQKPLDICAVYNKSSCNQSDCQQLHMCLSFITGRAQCSRSDCQLSHNLLSPSCCRLLKLRGLPTNESPRDIVAMLMQANPSLSQASDQSKKTKINPTSSVSSNNQMEKSGTNNSLENKKPSVSGKTLEKRHKTQSSEESNGNDSVSGDEDEIKLSKKDESSKIISNSQSTKSKSKNDKSENKTLWSHYLLGNVTTPAICYHSVEGVCNLEAIGCPLLHASQHFHWQVRQKSSRWMNLRPNQVTCIERAFCDPSQNGVDLPRLDPATLEMSVSGLLSLLGRDVWHADFPDNQNFTLNNTAKTVILELRRLCTQVLPGQPMLPAKYVWYFLDEMQKWVIYGNVDTLGKTNLVSSITSDDIENHFLQSPSLPLNFKNSKFTYTLDLQTMKQRNQQTNVIRYVRRRPKPHLPNEKHNSSSKLIKASADLPSSWKAMKPDERLLMVTLAPTSSEYQTVMGLVTNKVSANVVKVQRIQNPFLWRAYQNKVKEITTVYKSSNKVKIRWLFHGTSHNVISSICTENLDWRLHGSASGQAYGRGTYFSTDPSYSYNYCRVDPKGLKYMFVVRVAVGSVILGNSTMVRPPTNPATSIPYDSTGNAAGTIIVKYDKQEYFPDYLITFQSFFTT